MTGSCQRPAPLGFSLGSPMRNDSPSPSPDLLAANDRLLALRRALGRDKAEKQPESPAAAVHLRSEPRTGFTAPQPSPADFASPKGPPTLIENLPPHLGWESTAVTAHLRQWSMADGQLPIIKEKETAKAGTIPKGGDSHTTFPTPHAALDTPNFAIRNTNSAVILLPALALVFLIL